MLFLNRQRPLMLSCDWLQWSGLFTQEVGECRDNFGIECPEFYRMEILKGNNQFKHRLVLYDFLGRKVITMLWAPKNIKITRWNLVLFEVANYFLYDYTLRDVIALTRQIHDYEFCSLTRIDICMDFQLSRRDEVIIRQLYNGKCYVANKHEGSKWWNMDSGEEFPHDMNFGSMKSDFKWKLYNKSKEIKAGHANCTKPYIVDCWREIDFDIRKVWRCEISIKKGNGLQYRGRPMVAEDACNNEFLYNLYRDCYENRLIMRRNQRHSRKTNDKRVYLFKMDDFRDSYERLSRDVSLKRYEKNLQADAQSTINMNKMCDILESPQAMVSEHLFWNVANALRDYLLGYRLERYFKFAKGIDVDSYIQGLYEQSGFGKVELAE